MSHPGTPKRRGDSRADQLRGWQRRQRPEQLADGVRAAATMTSCGMKQLVLRIIQVQIIRNGPWRLRSAPVLRGRADGARPRGPRSSRGCAAPRPPATTLPWRCRPSLPPGNCAPPAASAKSSPGASDGNSPLPPSQTAQPIQLKPPPPARPPRVRCRRTRCPG
jgi:hypothetical protein